MTSRFPRKLTIPRIKEARLSNSWSQLQTDNNTLQAAGPERTIIVSGINGITISGLEGNPDILFIDGSGVGGVVDHGGLTGLSDDDHPQYVLTDGTRLMTGNLQTPGIQFTLTGVHVHTEGLVHWDDDDKALEVDTEVNGVSLQVGQEMYIRATNKTGATITNGQIVYVNGAQGSRPTVTLAKGDAEVTSSTTIGVATHDINDNDTGYVTTAGLVRDLDTSGTVAGDQLYLSPITAGAFTNVKPDAPDHAVRLGYSLFANPSSGIILVRIQNGFELEELHDVHISGVANDNILQWVTANSRWENTEHPGVFTHLELDSVVAEMWGSIVETIDITVDASGANTELQLQGDGATDLTVVTASGLTTVDTTPALTVNLTDGSSTVPQLNYVYLDNNLLLTNSTSGWPATFHVPIAQVLLLDKATTATDGALKVHAYTDHLSNSTGHIIDIGKKIRVLESTWESGVATTPTPAVSGSGASVSVATTAGIVFQMHPHTFPAEDSSTDGINITNHNTTPFVQVTDLATQVADSEGVSLTNKYYTLVIWGVVSEKSGDCHLMCNLPSGSYNNQALASRDADQYANYAIPQAFRGVGFLICSLELRNVSDTTFTLNALNDLRGLSPATTAGGGAGITDHGDLAGLTDDDHTQYLLVDGSRNMTGTLVCDNDLQVKGLDIYGGANNSLLRVAGGGGANDGGDIRLYGSTHATNPNYIFYSADTHIFRKADATGTMATLNSTKLALEGTLQVKGIDIFSGTNSSLLRLAGGGIEQNGALIRLFGSTHATPSHMLIDADRQRFRLKDTTTLLELNSTENISNNDTFTFKDKAGTTTFGVIDATHGLVNSFNGREGLVVPADGDYSLSGLSDTTFTSTISGQVLQWDGSEWINATNPAGVTDHGLLTGLTDDDHSQYVASGGRSGGQFVVGGIDSGDDLDLSSTSHATKGEVRIDNLYFFSSTSSTFFKALSVRERLSVVTSTSIGTEALLIDQNDIDEPFVDYQGTIGADVTSSISSHGTAGSIVGWLQIEVNGTKQWMPYYGDPSA